MALKSDEFVLQSSKCLLRVRCRDKAKHSRKLILAKTNFEHRCCQQWKTFRDKRNKVINSNEIQRWVSTTLQVVILLTATLSSFFANTNTSKAKTKQPHLILSCKNKVHQAKYHLSSRVQPLPVMESKTTQLNPEHALKSSLKHEHFS